jgi:hypothetical protein
MGAIHFPPDRPPKVLARQAKLLFCVKGGQRLHLRSEIRQFLKTIASSTSLSDS